MILKTISEQVKLTIKGIFFPSGSTLSKLGNDIRDYCQKVLEEDVFNDVGYKVDTTSSSCRYDIDVSSKEHYYAGNIGIVITHATAQNGKPIRVIFCNDDGSHEEKLYNTSTKNMTELKNDIKEQIESFIADVHIMLAEKEEFTEENEPWRG